MTTRLYYHDAYATRFQARIVERQDIKGKHAVVLDQTFFYPTSGGQPHDLGRINGIRLIDVLVRPASQIILHFLEESVESDDISGEINWDRRFDHMQQHTGQHILSQAFVRTMKANTVGFHLGRETCTIDLDQDLATDIMIDEVELLANRIVWENRSVQVRMVPQVEISESNLRKIPQVEGELFRLVEIEDFDASACGGTHVANTGEIGQIKIIGQERRKGLLRIEFVCGRRALFDYRVKNRIIMSLAADMTTGYWRLGKAIGQLQEEIKQTRRLINKQSKRLIHYETQALLTNGSQLDNGLIIVKKVFKDREVSELNLLAKALIKHSPVVVLFGLTGQRSHFVFARSPGLDYQMNHLLREAMDSIGSKSGGGNGAFAQGSGPAAKEEALDQILQFSEGRLSSQIDF